MEVDASASRHLLFLCTGNSARSILAEAILNARAGGRFRAFSAGSRPAGRVHPAALRQLEQAGLRAAGLRSKSWDEFARPGAPVMDLIITVCDNAAREPCPVWPGHPAAAHWSTPDPAAADGSADEIARAFREAYESLDRRITALLALPWDTDSDGARRALSAQAL
jgi:arsenate reductase